ncbi:unnamed protein product [Phytophthora fragariaefolia]|uniref:Unnamed protein product n=1 Tax=Phytophthora fragariaefolia TaxID=1490495 RepID=A0A9W6TX68_9STRA|nr:unnamed protein product [Phytophthora fragariaefolia]
MLCRPSGLTRQNEELHARLSADEMSVADRTRKRTHEETQCTQSPTKVVPSPPRPRPVKKIRRVVSIQHVDEDDESQPLSEPTSTPVVQPAVKSGAPSSSTAAGKRRRRQDVPVASLQKMYFEATMWATLQQRNKQKENEKLKKENERLKKENEMLKKNHQEELEKIKAEATTELEKVKSEASKQKETSKKEISEIRQDRDGLNQILQDILVDPKNPTQVRRVAELEAALKQHIQKERKANLQNNDTAMKLVEDIIGQSSMRLSGSGSSQSQDSIDTGRLHNHHRDLQLSNEHSEPSPGDLPQTIDEETKSGDSSQGVPPLFTTYGARSAPTADSGPASNSFPGQRLLQTVVGNPREDDEDSKTQQTDESKEN